jgi:hypothetical protein
MGSSFGDRNFRLGVVKGFPASSSAVRTKIYEDSEDDQEDEEEEDLHSSSPSQARPTKRSRM